MNKILLLATLLPIFAAMLIGISNDLVDLSDKVSTKTIDYTQQMADAMPCALEGIDLKQCSPELYETNFDEETDEFKELNSQIIDDMQELLDRVKERQ